MRGLGIGWAQLVSGVDHDLSAYQTSIRDQWRSAGAPQELIDQAAALMHSASQLYPGLLAIAGIAGLRLAWAWYHRLAVAAARDRRPPPSGRSSSTTSSCGDGSRPPRLVLIPVAEPWRLLGANLLLVLGVLYAARGLAVVVAQSRGVAGPVGAVLTLVAMLVLPFVVGGLTLLGLADTWLDFRRRLSTPTTGGTDR